MKTLIAIAVAGAFAVPLAVQASASSDSIVIAQASDAGNSTRQPGTQAGTSGEQSAFDRLDKNRDGFISRDEADGAVELFTRFSELDKNNDSKISREEYKGLGADRGARSARGATGTGSQGGMGSVPDKGPVDGETK